MPLLHFVIFSSAECLPRMNFVNKWSKFLFLCKCITRNHIQPPLKMSPNITLECVISTLLPCKWTRKFILEIRLFKITFSFKIVFEITMENLNHFGNKTHSFLDKSSNLSNMKNDRFPKTVAFLKKYFSLWKVTVNLSR